MGFREDLGNPADITMIIIEYMMQWNNCYSYNFVILFAWLPVCFGLQYLIMIRCLFPKDSVII